MSSWVILASGPSLTAEQCERVRQWREAGGGKVIAINTTWEQAPWADALYGCAVWWRYNHVEVRRKFKGESWTEGETAAKAYGLKRIPSCRGVGLSRDPKVVYQGGGVRGSGNSGYQAINLAFHWGAKRIVLLGYDMKLGDHEKKNWHPPHPVTVASPYESWVVNYRPLAIDLAVEGVTVINATPDSALDCFQRISVERAIGARAVLAA